MIPSEIIVGVLAFLGTMGGAYLSNRKRDVLIAYRLEQVEKKVDRLDYSRELAELRERVTVLESERKGGGDHV